MMGLITTLYWFGFIPAGIFFFRKRANRPLFSTLFWPYVGAFLLIVALASRQKLGSKVVLGGSVSPVPPATDAPTINRPKYGVIEAAED